MARPFYLSPELTRPIAAIKPQHKLRHITAVKFCDKDFINQYQDTPTP
ncbi:MAG: hypothetical protein ACI82I_001968 [Gammaproteobacteria bacterium]|jgi:hypothetical protein